MLGVKEEDWTEGQKDENSTLTFHHKKSHKWKFDGTSSEGLTNGQKNGRME